MIHYEAGLGSWTYDFLDRIFDTDVRIGVPYVINKNEYFEMLKTYGIESRFKDTAVVTFSADVTYEDKNGDTIYSETLPEEHKIAYRAFFVFPKGSPEGSGDFYDCIQFGCYNNEKLSLENYEGFVRDLLRCVKYPSIQHAKGLICEKIQELEKITHEISELNKIVY